MRPAILVLVLALLAGTPACKRSRPADGAAPADAAARDLAPTLANIDAALARGGAMLASRQQADGAIRSPTYAAFRDGYALTGLAALALGLAPGDPAARAYPRAVDFVATLVDGARLREPAPAYPTYAYGLAVLVLQAPGNERHRAARDVLRTELRARQLGPARGWLAGDPSYGGWGYFDARPARPAGPITDDLLSSNLSTTLLAIGALALGGVAGDDPALALARGFVERCQADDGGFFFSPAVADGNKAGAVVVDGGGPRFRAYGSMTADGVRALLRLGAPLEDPRVRAAASWLATRFDPARNPGEFPAIAEVRRASSYFYWTWTAAHALRALGQRELATAAGPVDWPTALAAELLRRQRPDGSWRNPSSEMREDDPVVATAFAMAGLTVARTVLAGEPRGHASWR